MDNYAISLKLLCSKEKINEEQGRVSVGFNCFRLRQATVTVPVQWQQPFTGQDWGCQVTGLAVNVVLIFVFIFIDRLCGLAVRVLGYRSGGPGSIPGTTRKKKSSGSGTGSTQPREYKLRSYLIEK
jgi:hypothetical protein